jgi:hypothetical protein
MHMKNNMGTIDRLVRMGIAVVIVILYTTDVICGYLGIILLVLAGNLIVTGILGYSPLYEPFKITTKEKFKEPGKKE